MISIRYVVFPLVRFDLSSYRCQGIVVFRSDGGWRDRRQPLRLRIPESLSLRWASVGEARAPSGPTPKGSIIATGIAASSREGQYPPSGNIGAALPQGKRASPDSHARPGRRALAQQDHGPRHARAKLPAARETAGACRPLRDSFTIRPMSENLPAADSRPGRLLARGVCRHLLARDFATVEELAPAPGLRVDVMALGPKAEIWVVECKSRA